MFSTLLQSESRQTQTFTNRAAALFPVFDLNHVDLILAFDDYWSWKRSIAVTYSLSIRSESGELIFKSVPVCPLSVNAISIRNLAANNADDVQCVRGGTVEIEIRSDENLQFPFPAILGYYEDNSGRLSVVHSSGRTLERSEPACFSEGGFYVSTDSRYEPFIHVFNGGFGEVSKLSLRLSLFTNDCCREFVFSIKPIDSPYGSKIIFLSNYLKRPEISELLATIEGSEDEICSPVVVAHILGECSSIYPRFVCGNLLKSTGLPYVAHTFREVTSESDLLDLTTEPALPRLRIPPLPNPLNVMVAIYPYAYPYEIPVEIYECNNQDVVTSSSKMLAVSASKDIFSCTKSSQSDSSLFVRPVGNDLVVPARISCNLSLFFEDAVASAFTDIALGINRASSKNKYNHWFTFLLRPDFTLALSGASYFLELSSIDFELILYLQDVDESSPSAYAHTYSYTGHSFLLPLDSVFDASGLSIKSYMGKACSVVMKMRDTRLDHLICLGYNLKNNSIFAEHSF
ncbi:hypothetical protein OAE87_01395 [bacterium]|nr:hypothetical protein [bacterium]